MKLCEVSTGDIAYRCEKSIVMFLQGKRKVLSTSVYNDGYHENLTAVFNHDGTRGAGMSCEMLADTYEEHIIKAVKEASALEDVMIEIVQHHLKEQPKSSISAMLSN